MLGLHKSSLGMVLILLLLLVLKASLAADAGQPGPSGQRVRPASNSPPGQPAAKRPSSHSEQYKNALAWSNIFFKIYPGAQAKKQTYQDLEKWGWKRAEGTELPQVDVNYLRSPLLALGAGEPSQQHGRVCFSHKAGEETHPFLYHVVESTPACLDQFMFHDAGVVAVTEMNQPSEGTADAQNTDGDKLDEWQDVMAVAWQTLCQLHNTADTACDRLTWILMSKITDRDFLDIMETALNGDWQNIKIWPGNSFPTSTDPGKALLGMPIGRQVAKLIAQHQDMFPGKIVVEVVVYDPLGSINGGEIPEDWLDRKYPGLAFRIGDNSQQNTHASGTSSHSGTALQLSQPMWQQAVAAGRQMVIALDSGRAFQPQSTVNAFTDITPHGWVQRAKGIPAFNVDAVLDAYQHFGLDPRFRPRTDTSVNGMSVISHRGLLRNIYHDHLKTWTIAEVPYNATGAEYLQAATPGQGVLVLQKHLTMQQAAEPMPQAQRPINYSPGSDWRNIGLILWKQACEEIHLRPEILQYVFIVGINDPETVSLAATVWNQRSIESNFRAEWRGVPGKSTDGQAFSTTSEQGMALVGSPLGQQVAGMLGYHHADFPQSRIDTVFLYYVSMDWTDQPRRKQGTGPPPGPVENQPCLVFHVEK
ncbi:hypothetical protein LTR78_006745 [Recurvomyces mirabilis]|uniref:Uncharacterized protein n=1 Tax=Recurvomyces mirabilis TaxID=574656 RepID=A0AAE0WKQ8_9PEZI|nr:hypothetical protein LTR78_006745 [Recurvomyces mirabilis]KAK5151366.1 hypothetical protein LTS14_009209 [Recurvomyces mirabilis]